MSDPISFREQLTAAQQRHRDIEAKIDELWNRRGRTDDDDAQIAALGEQIQRRVREVLGCARATLDESEIRKALADMCHVIADKNPQEAIDLAKEFQDLPAEDDGKDAAVEDALHVAYLTLGDEVRAVRHRAIAIRFRKERAERTGKQSGDQGAMAALRSMYIPLAGNEKVALEVNEPLEVWLSKKTEISLSDLAPSFGKFVTNDRVFYRTANDRLQMLSKRLQAGLSKPDNYLLIAKPGLGKSFFVRQFKDELKTAIDGKMKTAIEGKINFLERNLSAYDSIDAAFEDIITDVLIALTGRESVFLFVDEVDTLLNGKSMLERLIAPMNGDPFFFHGKQVSFAEKPLVVFFALSSSPEQMEGRQKWTDFLSRIPSAHRIALPESNSPLDRIYRAVSRLTSPVTRVEASALLYIGLREWTSVRELEQAVELAKTRAAISGAAVLELAHIAVSREDVEEVEKRAKSWYGEVDIFGSGTNVIDVV